MRLPILTTLVLTLFWFQPGQILEAGNEPGRLEPCLSGTVIDRSGKPVVGASVALYSDSIPVGGEATDIEGVFEICFETDVSPALRLKVLSIAHRPFTVAVLPDTIDGQATIILDSKTHPVKPVTVKPDPLGFDRKLKIERKTIENSIPGALVASDPIGSVQQPQVIRAGSNLSSKIRVSGTSPVYYLNSLEIGQDPNHYGLFSLIPASVVESMDLYTNGTPIEYGTPSALRLQTPWPEKPGNRYHLHFNLVDAGLVASITRPDFFILGGFRKSVLDRMSREIDMESERTTIPPTNYRDFFISSGIEISDHLRLAFDGFVTRDYLPVRLGPTSLNPSGIDTYQHARGEYFNARLEIFGGNFTARLNGGGVSRFEQYYARSAGDSPDNFYVNLKARHTTGRTGFDIRYVVGHTKIVLGSKLAFSDREHLSLEHNEWNFMPPDANSDHPHLYQEELNRSYNDLSLYRDDRQGAGYLSVGHGGRRWNAEAGLRIDHFEGLARQNQTSWRFSLIVMPLQNQALRLNMGSYFEHPLSRIIEPYQAAFRKHVSALIPVRTLRAGLRYEVGAFTAGVYRKKIMRLPVLWPQFDLADKPSPENESFLTAVSEGEIDFAGGDISFDLGDTILPGFDLFGYYAYARADKTTGPVVVPYELNARHTVYLRTRITPGKNIDIGSSFTARSGYAYTGPSNYPIPESGDIYTPEYYENYLSRENSSRFPASLQWNIQAGYSFESARIYAGVSNVTDHENAIINTSGGYIYDVGIMPVLGLDYTF